MAGTGSDPDRVNLLIVGQEGRLGYEAALFALSLNARTTGRRFRLFVAEPQPGPLWPDDPRIKEPALRELIEAQIEPFRPTDLERLEIKGTPFRLSNQAAQTLGLALHELATNASKYGAFATPSGRLTIQWKRSQGQLELLWREFVPRLRRRTVTPGFGTEVIERMLGGTLDAQIERVIHPNGLECRFTIPIARLEPERADAEGDRDEP